jgi:hypothetical protein
MLHPVRSLEDFKTSTWIQRASLRTNSIRPYTNLALSADADSLFCASKNIFTMENGGSSVG